MAPAEAAQTTTYGQQQASDDSVVPEPPKVTPERHWLTRVIQSWPTILRTILTIVGALALLCSLALAAGAFSIAIDLDLTTGIGMRLESGCDALAGPLGSAFSFSGDNAQQKQSLVVWGVGSVGYLIIGSFLQSIGRRISAR